MIAAFGYEIAVIIKDGMRRMYAEGEEYFYYLTLYNENYNMPAMPAGAEEGILKGLYKLIGLFKTNKAGDFIHLQGFNDGTVSYRRSLASLLQSVSVGNMKWAAAGGKLYESDLGLGGGRYGVGTAREIWDSKSAISKADLAKALNAKIAADKAFNIEKFFKLPAAPAVKNQPPAKQAGPPAPAVLKEADIKDAYLASMRKMLKSEFESADKHWAKWKPIP